MPVAISTKEKTWNKMFPNNFKTEQQSLVFMKKLFAVAISNIVYIRSIFPEYAFFDKQLEGIKLKILREDSKCPGASKVISWVRGCFDALDKRYLKTVIIGFYVDPLDPDTVIESYSFKFTYSSEGVSIKMNTEKKSAPNSETLVKNDDTPEEIKRATLSLLRTMILAGNTQDQLPDKVIVTMKLLYYDDVTPEDYEPLGFKTSDYAGFRHETETINAKLGHVETDFHSFRMILRTDKASFTENYLKGADTKKTEGTEQSEAAKAVNGTPSSSNNIRSGAVGSNPTNGDEGTDEDFHVRCPCGGNKDDGIMILCENCKNWQHSVCFCITEEEAVPESHLCDVCATEDGGLVCTDPKLVRLSVEERRELCLLRRSLVHCRSLEVVEPAQLAEVLGVEPTVGSGLFCTLQADGVLGNPRRRGKNRGLCKVVDKAVLEERLANKYFGDGQVVVVEPPAPVATRKRPSAAVTNLVACAGNISLEDHTVDIMNASQDSMLNDAPSKKRRRACVVKTPVVASRH